MCLGRERAREPATSATSATSATRVLRRGALVASCLLAAAAARAGAQQQQLALPPVAFHDTAALAAAMPRLAGDALAVYRNDGRRATTTYLETRFRLQVAAGRYADAIETLRALHARPGAPLAGTPPDVLHEVFARASLRARGAPSVERLRQAFRDVVGPMDDRGAALVVGALGVPQFVARQMLSGALQRQQGRRTIALADAVRLAEAYQLDRTYRSLAPLAASLAAEDDRRRYVVARDVPVGTPDGATVCAMVVRQRAAEGRRLPALLTFTIYADSASNFREARRTASHGYVAVTGLTRGKGCSPGPVAPYRHDGADAAALIDWIGRQPWSDGRVGMYGGSYNGFTQWAAAKHMPRALKALMTGAPAAPGIDVPMEGNVFWSFVYPWPFYTTDVKALDTATYVDAARWNRLDHDWYVSGRAYRDLDRIDGTPNPIFDEWLDHPAYDAYWQATVPDREEFARIRIPVLQTAGYYFGGPGAAVHYFTEHYAHDPAAEHYLVIGPYDHFAAQRGVVDALGDTTTVLAGYALDPVARMDIVADLRYPWFDYVFKGGPRPALLKDRVNYEVTGANVWRHAPTLAAMADRTLRLRLTAARSSLGGAYRLSQGPAAAPGAGGFVELTVDLADRRDVDRVAPGGGVVDTAVDTANAIEFVTDPLPAATEVSGLYAGRLDFVTNKRDFDFQVSPYELTPTGEYVQLAPYWARASYVGHPDRRRLLTPGARERLDFRSARLTSRRLRAGSRLVVVLGVIKEPGRQINYGTGKDVSDETIADAGAPLRIRWYDDSFIDLPVRAPAAPAPRRRPARASHAPSRPPGAQ